MTPIRGVEIQPYPFTGFKAHLGKVEDLTYKGNIVTSRKFFCKPEVGCDSLEERGLYAVLNHFQFTKSIRKKNILVYIDGKVRVITVDTSEISWVSFINHLFYYLNNSDMTLETIIVIFML